MLDFQQDHCLPVVQLHDLVILNDAACKRLLILGLDSVDDRIDKFTLASGCKCRVLGHVLLDVSFGGDRVLCGVGWTAQACASHLPS